MTWWGSLEWRVDPPMLDAGVGGFFLKLSVINVLFVLSGSGGGLDFGNTAALGLVGASAPCARRCLVEIPLPDAVDWVGKFIWGLTGRRNTFGGIASAGSELVLAGRGSLGGGSGIGRGRGGGGGSGEALAVVSGEIWSEKRDVGEEGG